MNTLTRRLRSGFCGIELLVAVIIVAAIYAGVTKYGIPLLATGGQKSGPTTQGSGTVQTLNVAAHTGAAVMQMTGGTGNDQPVVVPTPDPTTPDPTAAEPASGDWLGDILESIFDAF
jgi:hypothetical protein